MERTTVTAQQVADYFMFAVDEDEGDSMSNLRLQKLLYFAQAWYLANFDKPLFAEDFEAWMHGPVIPAIYRKYKRYGRTAIPTPTGPAPDLNRGIRIFLDEVWDVYGALSTGRLADITHQERPWIEARAGCDPGAPCSNIISQESMRDYYMERLDESRQK